MEISTNRIIALVLLDFVLFALAAFLMLQVMPKPLKPFDYLLVGGVATLISLLGLWFLIWRETPKKSGFLFEKRPKK
jgi:uncharacterized membrane protein YbhN (UPF0104 family)